jgi:hypothetical protein
VVVCPEDVVDQQLDRRRPGPLAVVFRQEPVPQLGASPLRVRDEDDPDPGHALGVGRRCVRVVDTDDEPVFGLAVLDVVFEFVGRTDPTPERESDRGACV